MNRDALLIALAALLVYANSLANGFAFDDVVVVRDNPLVTSGSAADIFRAPYWPEENASRYRPEVTYRPVTVLSFAAMHRAGGGSPFPQHLLNVLLHALASVLVWRLGGALAGGVARARWGLLAAGLLYAVHPVHTEAVAGIVGRAELLAVLAWTAALIAHLRRWPAAPVLILLLTVAGGLSKESAVTVPAAILVLAAARRNLGSRESMTDIAAATLGVIAVLGLRAQVLGAALDPGAAPTYWDGGDAVTRLATAAVAFARYLQLFAWPATLSADYSFQQIPVATGFADPRALAGIALAAGLAVLGVRSARLGTVGAVGIVGGGLGLFFVAYLPVSHVLFPVNVILAERLLMIPSVGLSLAVAAAAVALTGRWSRPARRPAAAAFGGVILLALAARTVARNPVWKDDATLFEATVRDAPRSAKAWVGLSHIRADAGRADEARACLEAALRIDPDSYGALDGLGHLELERGAYAEALRFFQEAARVSPRDPAPLYNAGTVQLRGGAAERSVAAFEAALRIDPDHAASVAGIAAARQTQAAQLAAGGRAPEAEALLAAAIPRVRELGGDASGLQELLAEIRRRSRGD